MHDEYLPLSTVDGGVRIRIKLTPKAASNRIGPVEKSADGGAVLKVAVTVAPENGKANAQLIKLLSKAWKIPKTRLTLVAGAKDRRKTLQIDGDTGVMMKYLEKYMRENHG